MIRSMTAYAQVTTPAREGSWVVEIRGLNHRYFEFSLKIPPALSPLENSIRELVQSEIRRGKVTVAVSQETARDKFQGLSLDETAARFYLTALYKLKKKFHLKDEISLGDLLKLPGIFTAESSLENPEKYWASLKKVLKKALAKSIRAKEEEGRKLAIDMLGRLEKIAGAVHKIETHAVGRMQHLFKKLSGRVDLLLAEKEKDLERVHREAAFLAERSDISEEVVRMKSHLELFRSKLKGGSEVGRELDFLCQEMNREVNTMASKAQHFEISTEVVFVKGELEKIREQIQNIE